jgi:hypothetical protein
LAQVAQVLLEKTAAHKETHHNLVLILRVLVVGMVESLTALVVMVVQAVVQVMNLVLLEQEHQVKVTTAA